MNNKNDEIIFRDNRYWECYALLTIRYILYKDFLLEDHCLKDKPDIEMEYKYKNYGIEVTRLIEETQASDNYIINKYYGKGMDPLIVKKNIEKKSKNLKVYIYNGTTICSYTYDKEEIKKLLNNKILKKQQKAIYYKKSDVNCLYIFISDYGFNKDEIITFMDNISFNNYDKIIFNNYDEIYIFGKNSLETYIIDETALKRIKNKSINYVKKLLNKKRLKYLCY